MSDEAWDYTLPSTTSDYTVNSDGEVESEETTSTTDTSGTYITVEDFYAKMYDLLANYPSPIRIGQNNQVIRFDITQGMWVGHSEFSSAPFRVSMAGAITATSATITGALTTGASSVIDGQYLSTASVASAAVNLAMRGWTTTTAFSITDADTVAWGAGTFTASDGTSYSIGAGNTGNMAARTYIYLDIAVSTTAYQSTTTATTAVGNGKVMVATALNGSVEPTYEVYGGVGGTNIDASSIVASSITANEIAASTITAGKLTVSTLSSITADLGNITAGTIVLPSGGLIRSGQTAYNSGTGFYIGNDSGTPKFSIGDGSTNYVTWNGTTLSVTGSLSAQTVLVAGQAIDAGNNVSLNSSDNKVYRTRVTALGSESSTTISNGGTVTAEAHHKFLSISSTVKVFAKIDDTADGCSIDRIVIDPTTSGVTSASATTITSAITSPAISIDMIKISDTVAVIAYASATQVFVKVLSGLDTTVTQGTEVELTASGAGGGVSIASVSATEMVVFYYVSGTEVRGRKVTLSGTTLTGSTASTVYSTATTQIVLSAVQFSTAATYCVLFSESTTNSRAIAATYSGGSLTPGTAISLGAFDVVAVSSDFIDTTNIIVSYKRNSNNELYAQVITTAGTVLTAGTALNVATSSSLGDITLGKLGKYTYVASYKGTSSTSVYNVNLLEVVGTTVSSLNTATTSISPTSRISGSCYHSPAYVLLGCYDNAGPRMSFTTFALTNNYLTWVGVAVASAAAAANCTFISHGISDDASGLTAGNLYYTDIDGGYTTLTNGTRVGFSTSTTNVIVRT